MGLRTPWKKLFSVAVLSLIGVSASAEPKVPTDWKTDCVGRMQISLPGDVDIAAMLPKDLINELNSKGDSPYKFEDGQDASWSSSGWMKITHPTTSMEKRDIDNGVKNRWNKVRAYTKKNQLPPLVDVATGDLDGRAWGSNDFYDAFVYSGKISIHWGGGTNVDEMPMLIKAYKTFIAGLRPRSTFDVPQDPGVCLPYLFVKDDGTQGRHIGMTYRLKAHPDITVWLEDASAAIVDPRMKPSTYTDKGKAAYFWERRYGNRRSFQSLWPFHYAFKDTTMAGQKGIKTFVELTRDDEAQTKDYGYLVAVRGDPDAKTDTPDLMLYVIQDSVNATRRGIKPLDKDAFLEMAETIAASVRRRETSQ